MTKRERVLQAVSHRQPDITPYQIDFTAQAAQSLDEYTGSSAFRTQIGNHFTEWGYGGQEEIAPGYFRDIFGVVWNKNGADKDIGVVDEIILSEPSLSNYSFPKIDEAAIKAGCKLMIENAGDRCVGGAIGFSMFERAWTLRGMENLLMDMVVEPDFAHALLDAICEHNLKIIDACSEFGLDFFYFGDDWGQQKGTIMGPEHWRTFIKPRVARMYERAKRSCKFVVQHSCGDIEELFTDLIDIGLDVYQTFQPEIYDVAKVKKEYGGDLSFWGGISTQRLLPYASPEEVKRVAREMIGAVGKNGGYIAAPTHAVPCDVPPENIIALAEVFESQ